MNAMGHPKKDQSVNPQDATETTNAEIAALVDQYVVQINGSAHTSVENLRALAKLCFDASEKLKGNKKLLIEKLQMTNTQFSKLVLIGKFADFIGLVKELPTAFTALYALAQVAKAYVAKERGDELADLFAEITAQTTERDIRAHLAALKEPKAVQPVMMAAVIAEKYFLPKVLTVTSEDQFDIGRAAELDDQFATLKQQIEQLIAPSLSAFQRETGLGIDWNLS